MRDPYAAGDEAGAVDANPFAGCENPAGVTDRPGDGAGEDRDSGRGRDLAGVDDAAGECRYSGENDMPFVY
jgi:hypothetical protein